MPNCPSKISIYKVSQYQKSCLRHTNHSNQPIRQNGNGDLQQSLSRSIRHRSIPEDRLKLGDLHNGVREEEGVEYGEGDDLDCVAVGDGVDGEDELPDTIRIDTET